MRNICNVGVVKSILYDGMKKIAFIFFVAAILLPAASLSAKDRDDDQPESRKIPFQYAYPTTVELSLGYAGSPYSVKGDEGNASGVMSGASSFFRFSGFFTKHVGGFFQIGIMGAEPSEMNYFGTLNRADGDRYRYSGGVPDSEYLPLLLAGPVARFDFGKLSVRPRLGLGVAWFSSYENSYKRIDRDADSRTAPATYFHIYYSHPASDYLVDGESYYDNYFLPTFVIAPSVQLTYSIKPHFFFSVEAGYNISTRKASRTVYRAGSVDAYNPESFVEELYLSDYIGTYREGDGQLYDRVNGTVADFFYLNLGLGWNIGHNRNQKGRYYHKY